MNIELSPLSKTLHFLSILIPARNEEGSIQSTVEHLHLELSLNHVPHEIVVVDDGSSDQTWKILTQLKEKIPQLQPVQNTAFHGIGHAIIHGFACMKGDAVVIMMADESDDARDVVRYWHLLNEGYDAVFGSRFLKGGGVIDYPLHKLILNRIFNVFIRTLFQHGLNDTTNAFKAYRKSTIDGLQPLISPHFNLLVELPLKTHIRRYSWTTIPITWRNRRSGVSKLKIREMGSRYLFVVLYCWLERFFSRDDYMKKALS